MTPRVLLTGATGFVGRHAVAPLLARGFEVHVAARVAARAAPALPGVVSHSLDLLDPSATASLLRLVRPTHLLHLAWDVTPGRYWRALENLDWVAASLHLYRGFVDNGGTRAVFAGTCAEYDWSDGRLEETAKLRPATLYGAAKHALHGLLEAAAAVDGCSLAWGRVFFLYGPHVAPARLAPSVIVPLLRGEPALVADGLPMRDFMHAADAAAALVTVLDSGHVGAINIATGRMIANRTLIMTLAEQIGRPELVRFGARPTPLGEPPCLGASGASLAALGFRCGFDLAGGAADTIAWWRDHLTEAERLRPSGQSGRSDRLG